MSVYQKQNPWQTLHWVLSPILAFGIYLSIQSLKNTYELVENYQRESIWSLVQLNTQLNSTQYDFQIYSLGDMSEKELRLRYELLWSKFPVVLTSLDKDQMLNKIEGLKTLINEVFEQIKLMEPTIYSGESIESAVLSKWIAQMNHAHETIHRYLLHEVTDADGTYSKESWKQLLTSLYFVAGSSLIFFVHIAYLLLTLARERSESQFQLSHDALTGLASRNTFMQALEENCQSGKPFTLAIMDLNKFKKINDNHGHQVGDHVLQHLANELRNTLGKHGLVGRLGGDEFAWLVHNSDRELINRYYASLLEKLQRPCVHENNEFMIKLSTGACASHGDISNHKIMLTQADEAMYQAKKKQSKNIDWYKPKAFGQTSLIII